MSSLILFLSSGPWLSLLGPSNLILDSLSSGLMWVTLSAIMLSYTSSSLNSSSLWWLMSIIVGFVFMSQELLEFFIFFELSLIPIIIMLIYLGSQPERLSAGAYLLLYTLLFSLPFMVFIVKTLGGGPSFNETNFVDNVTLILVVAPFLVKMPVLGLHFWLPKAHVEANTSGSMVLAGLLLKLGSYGLYRMSTMFMFALMSAPSSGLWLMWSTVSSVITFVQTDAKKYVAYSSITHMTFMLVGIVSISKVGLLVVLFTSLAHAWASMAMFSMAGALSSSSTSRLSLLLAGEGGLHWLSLSLGVLLLVNASVPPLPSFLPEALSILVVKNSSASALVFFLFLSSFVCYYNVYFFLGLSHSKEFVVAPKTLSPIEGVTLFLFMCLALITLGWLESL